MQDSNTLLGRTHFRAVASGVLSTPGQLGQDRY